MTHVRTSPYYPQSNGKQERLFKTYKKECIRPKTPLAVEDAIRVTEQFVRSKTAQRDWIHHTARKAGRFGGRAVGRA